ncbi:MAG: hypothetical protein WBF13_05145, partial [Candidatus Zixiibacteriota bacterium]
MWSAIDTPRCRSTNVSYPLYLFNPLTSLVGMGIVPFRPSLYSDAPPVAGDEVQDKSADRSIR